MLLLVYSFTQAPRTGSAETPQRGLRQLAAPEELRRAAGLLLVAGTSVRDLLLRAKYLFVAATVPPFVRQRPPRAEASRALRAVSAAPA